MNFTASIWILGDQGQGSMDLIVSPYIYPWSPIPQWVGFYSDRIVVLIRREEVQRSLCMLMYWGMALLANRERRWTLGESGKITQPHWYPGGLEFQLLEMWENSFCCFSHPRWGILCGSSFWVIWIRTVRATFVVSQTYPAPSPFHL